MAELASIARWIFFWLLVFGATGINFSANQESEDKKVSYSIGNENPTICIALAILAYVFRPW